MTSDKPIHQEIGHDFRGGFASLELGMNRAYSCKVGIYECFLQSTKGENIQVCLFIQVITCTPKLETSVSADLILVLGSEP